MAPAGRERRADSPARGRAPDARVKGPLSADVSISCQRSPSFSTLHFLFLVNVAHYVLYTVV